MADDPWGTSRARGCSGTAGSATGQAWSLLRLLVEASAAADELAAGDLRARIPVADEVHVDDLSSSFNRMADVIEERVSRAERFAADVSHDLRAPLTTLAGAAAILAEARARLSPVEAEAVELLTAELHRFQRLVDDLLQLAHVRSAPSEPVLDTFPLDDLVRAVVAGSPEPQVPVHVEAGAAGRAVVTDKRRLRRALENLLQNARVHAGGPTAVRIGLADGHACVAVEDAGPGVPEAEREWIFEPFRRGEAASRTGTGLGLTLVRQHLTAVGGSVEVEDGPGGGARFVLRLPVGAGPSDVAGPTSDAPVRPGSSTSAGPAPHRSDLGPAPGPTDSIEARVHADLVRVVVSGEFDMSCVEQAEAVHRVVVQARRPVIVDTSGVTFAGASLARVLVRLRRAASAWRLEGTSAPVLRLLRLTGLTHLLEPAGDCPTATRRDGRG
ncbi:STAS domain-containing protein [Geodermatophilus sp. DF01-2]|uniref:ATP-binding protein n=1 Tax=Geodermatophilus sp. DF01-2 TaxID=2559610 RepID=UPI001073DF26|nr:ATP-binding protein [Geodermatophilus sp. DF01_2]TFV63984.1 STAS domain-containing protein [Geodermatophilus sp. DF01_2]